MRLYDILSDDSIEPNNIETINTIRACKVESEACPRCGYNSAYVYRFRSFHMGIEAKPVQDADEANGKLDIGIAVCQRTNTPEYLIGTAGLPRYYYRDNILIHDTKPSV